MKYEIRDELKRGVIILSLPSQVMAPASSALRSGTMISEIWRAWRLMPGASTNLSRRDSFKIF